jgi:hypothetical protein
MSTQAIAPVSEFQLDDKTLFALVTDGDCRKLTDAQKLAYYKARCDAAGLDYRAQPFQFISLSGKLVLYALKACTDQLSAKHGIRCELLDQRTDDGIRVVTVRAVARDGRQTDEIGAVNVKNLQGEALCNAFMKASTKAKRRAILAVCGLGMLDETELDTIPGAQAAPQPTIMQPRRLSERKPEHVVVVEPGFEEQQLALEPEFSPPPEDDLEPLLRASLDATDDGRTYSYIDESQRRRLFALMRESGHTKDAVSAWLKRRGIESSKTIRTDQYEMVKTRLASSEPLEA